MTYFKSVVAGLGVLLVAAFGFVVVTLEIATYCHIFQVDSVFWNFDPISFVKSPLGWITFGGPFLLGFAWEFRRLVSK